MEMYHHGRHLDSGYEILDIISVGHVIVFCLRLKSLISQTSVSTFVALSHAIRTLNFNTVGVHVLAAIADWYGRSRGARLGVESHVGIFLREMVHERWPF